MYLHSWRQQLCFLIDGMFCWSWYWRKAWKRCWGQMCRAPVSLMSCGRRGRQTGRQAARCLRIIPSDMLRTKRADSQISAPHSNDPEMTRWTVSSRQKDSDPRAVTGCYSWEECVEGTWRTALHGQREKPMQRQHKEKEKSVIFYHPKSNN